MINFASEELKGQFKDNASCLEWLKAQIYPNGINCPVCKKVTKHHKLTKRACYCCDVCGNQVYPTAGTIFHKSTTPLKTWFAIISRILNDGSYISAREIQRKYGVTYKTARRMLQQIGKLLDENAITFAGEAKLRMTYDDRENRGIDDIGYRSPEMAGGVIASQPMEGSSREPPVREMRVKGPPGEAHKMPTLTHFSAGVSDFSVGAKSDKSYWKRDRTARLLKLQMLLWQHPTGLSIEEISQKCSVSLRTAYRDLNALESELEVPIWGKGSVRGIVEGYFLPAVPFTLMETIHIFLAVRLMQRCDYLYNPGLVSTIRKLNNIVPPKLRQQVLDTLAIMERQPRDERKIINLNKLIEAWLSRHMVKFLYRQEDKLIERVVEPYSIEPSEPGHSNYLIASCQPGGSIEIFKINNISGEVHICPDTYEIPSDFNAIDYISRSWGVHIDNDELVNAKIHFSQKSNVKETIWHPSQVMQIQKDGSVIWTLKVRNTRDFLQWVLGWGIEAEVLEPETLRNQIVKHSQALLEFYNSK
jgi:predicted DNA-binding transcriptional regulator YafY